MFQFNHDREIKAGCYNFRVQTTYWMADSQEEAKREIAENTDYGREEHGPCPRCLARLLAEDDYEVVKE